MDNEDIKKRLSDRKEAIHKLAQVQEKQEKELSDSLGSHKNFLDPKNTKTRPSYESLIPTSTEASRPDVTPTDASKQQSKQNLPGSSQLNASSTKPSTQAGASSPSAVQRQLQLKPNDVQPESQSKPNQTKPPPRSFGVRAPTKPPPKLPPEPTGTTTTSPSNLGPARNVSASPSQDLINATPAETQSSLQTTTDLESNITASPRKSRKSILRQSIRQSKVTNQSMESKEGLKPWVPKGDRARHLLKTEDAEKDANSEESTGSSEMFEHVLAVLECLEDLSYVFMKRIFDKSDVEGPGVFFHHKGVDLSYQIFSLGGDLLFLMEQQTVKCTSFILFARRSYENTLYDMEGNKILKFLGPMIILSRMITSSLVTDSHGGLLGYIKPFGSKCNYSVYNAKGQRLFLILSNTVLPSSTTIFMVLCKGKQIGMIKYAWKRSFHEQAFLDFETAGVEFPSEMDEREKALLIGAMILIEFTWFSPITKLKVSTILAVMILFALALVITVLPLILDKQKTDVKTKAFFQPSEIFIKKSYYNVDNNTDDI